MACGLSAAGLPLYTHSSRRLKPDLCTKAASNSLREIMVASAGIAHWVRVVRT
jgi:hypothetical protein